MSSKARLSARVLPLLSIAVVVSTGCREDRLVEPGDAETPTTIYQVQTPHQGATEPVLGSVVFLRSVLVSAFDTSPETSARREQDARGGYYCVEETGYTGAMVVQEIDGGPMSGVALFNPTVIPANLVLGPGDLVDVRGEYLEFCLYGADSIANSYCPAQDTHRLTQLGSASVQRVGEAQPPEAIDISSADLLNAAHAEQYEGTLVRVSERLEVLACQPTDSQGRPNCCVGSYDRYGNLSLSAGFTLTNEFYTVDVGVTCMTSITGVVTWFGNDTDWGDYSLAPRSAEDVEIPADCRP